MPRRIHTTLLKMITTRERSVIFILYSSDCKNTIWKYYMHLLLVQFFKWKKEIWMPNYLCIAQDSLYTLFHPIILTKLWDWYHSFVIPHGGTEKLLNGSLNLKTGLCEDKLYMCTFPYTMKPHTKKCFTEKHWAFNPCFHFLL